MRLTDDDELVDMLVVNPELDIFTLTSNGYGKRSSIEDYRLQSRGGKGIKAGIFNEKTGELVNLKLVSDDNDIMIITTGGTIIRMHADSISQIGRATRGVWPEEPRRSPSIIPKCDDAQYSPAASGRRTW